jgi:hypothetical protein
MKRIIILFFIFAIFYFPFISAGSYGVGNYGAGFYGVGQVSSNSTNQNPENGGTTGGPSCEYNWSCTNWFPSECPINGIQERICANRGTCAGTAGMPAETMNCTYNKTEPLFDIFLNVPASYKKICAGRDIKANVKLENYGKIELLDAFMIYWIMDENNTLVSELKDTRSIADKLNFDVSLTMPESASNGVYRLYAQITYSGNKTAVAGQSFEVNPDYCKFSNNIPIIIGAVIGIILILIIIFSRRLLNILKNRKQEKI